MLTTQIEKRLRKEGKPSGKKTPPQNEYIQEKRTMTLECFLRQVDFGEAETSTQ